MTALLKVGYKLVVGYLLYEAFESMVRLATVDNDVAVDHLHEHDHAQGAAIVDLDKRVAALEGPKKRSLGPEAAEAR